MTERKKGRPAKGENRDEMTSITFKVDRETLAALVALEGIEIGPETVRGGRSIVLRKIILEAFENRKTE